MDKERIARICYEATKAVAFSSGQNLPIWGRANASEKGWIRRFVSCHIKNPEATLENRHEQWVEKLTEEKWKVGKELDYQNRIHPHLVPFEKLPGEEKFKRLLIEAIVCGCTEE